MTLPYDPQLTATGQTVAGYARKAEKQEELIEIRHESHFNQIVDVVPTRLADAALTDLKEQFQTDNLKLHELTDAGREFLQEKEGK